MERGKGRVDLEPVSILPMIVNDLIEHREGAVKLIELKMGDSQFKSRNCIFGFTQ